MPSREVFSAAHSRGGAFVNVDMEEYKDLALTLEVFMRVLDEPALRDYSAGIVLQAYLPDSHGVLDTLTRWACARVQAGGAPVKVRIVKGANLAMERVDAAMHDWPLATYRTKAETDASYLALLDTVLRPENAGSLRVGIAGHNVFDLAWALLLAGERGVREAVTFEMLEGMAPGIARAVWTAGVPVLLYTPVVRADDFDYALPYLFRRLEENAGGENFLAHLPALRNAGAFEAEAERFGAAVAGRHHVRRRPFRSDLTAADPLSGCPAFFRPSTPIRAVPWPGRRSSPSSVRCPMSRSAEWSTSVGSMPSSTGPGPRRRHGPAGRRSAGRRRCGRAPTISNRCGPNWSACWRTKGRRPWRTPRLRSANASTSQGHMPPASLTRLGARRSAGGAARRGGRRRTMEFPLALSLGGAFAALAGGNAAIVKPAPQTPRTASFAIGQLCSAARRRAGGLPDAALQCVVVDDGPVGAHLIAHRGIDAVVLTGSYETAEFFSRLTPGRPLFAETSGKNAMVVMPEADLDLAAADLVRSAFGHAGQKCSAASIGILVGDVASSTRFSSQLLDAASSLITGQATDPAATMTPLVEPPSDRLRRALTTLEPHQRWLLEPRLIDKETELWSPGIVAGVRPGDWLAQTEVFGPVLALLAADDLEEAIRMQNSTVFGLTGGLWSLDPRHHRTWLERVEVGNAYINRAITGAIVGRQPFGGWKRSGVGPGAKAGGPNYVAQLMHFADAGRPTKLAEPGPEAKELLETVREAIDDDELQALASAARSDAYWVAHEFGIERDEARLFCERNVLRYRPVPVMVRVGHGATLYELARTLLALHALGSVGEVSVNPDAEIVGADVPLRLLDASGVHAVSERPEDFKARMARAGGGRIRLLGSEDGLRGLAPGVYVDARPTVVSGRVELLRYLREHSVSITMHRFGSPVGDG